MIAKIRENIHRVIVGKDQEIDLLLVALLTGGHVLIEDVPGSGKTMLAKSFAISIGCDFKRIQFTPDLLPSDITGIKYFNMKTSDFEFIPGPAFSNIILADEINRATPKTQSGLLECMEERQVTIEGETHVLPAPFMVIATQNPIENMGVFPLPEAQLDRFFVKIRMNYPSRSETVDILSKYNSTNPLLTLGAVVSVDDVLNACRQVNEVFVHNDLLGYVADLVAETRRRSGVVLGASTRASIALIKAAKGFAWLNGRSYVLPDDIKAMAIPVLAHRLILKTSLNTKKDGDVEIVKEILDEVRVPTEDFEKYRL